MRPASNRRIADVQRTAGIRQDEPGSVVEHDHSAAEQAGRILARFSSTDRVRLDTRTEDGTPLTFVLPGAAVRLLT